MEKLTVREMTADDVSVIAIMEGEIFSDAWSKKSIEGCLNDKAMNVFVIEDGSVLGYLIFSDTGLESELLRIAVLKDERKRGLGSIILEYYIDYLNRKETEKIFLEVRKSNEPAINLYGKFGFKKISERKNYYTDPTEDAIIMKIDLKTES